MNASSPPTILQVLPGLETGGVERGAIDMALAIQAAGWRAIVASEGGRMKRELDRAGVLHVALPLSSKNPLVMRANAKRLTRLIAEEKVSLVHARSRAPAWSAEAAARAAGVPFVTTFHGTYGLGPFGLKKRYNAVMTHGVRVIAISEFIRSHIVANYPIDETIIRVVPRGVDLGVFNPSKVSQDRMIALSTKWRLPDGVPVVMLPGRLTRWKGQILLLQALALIKDELSFQGVLVGDDQGRTAYRQEIEETAARLGLGGRVSLVGDCQDMASAYMLADVVVSASLEPEAFGRVAAEGLAMGRPVVVPDHGGGPEIVEDRVTGWQFAAGNAASLADALRAALTIAPKARADMAARAVAVARSRFGKERMTAQTLAVYREALGLTD